MPKPSVEQQLRVRAMRILSDRHHHHEPAALSWAAAMIGRAVPELTARQLQNQGFTLRELSLGSHQSPADHPAT